MRNPFELLPTNLLPPPIFAFAADVIVVLVRWLFRFTRSVHYDLAVSLGITFPFNLSFGIPLQFGLAKIPVGI